MVAIKAIADFGIPVSDIARSTRFDTEIVGCKHLFTVPSGHMAFLDAAGTCLILVKRPNCAPAGMCSGIEFAVPASGASQPRTSSRDCSTPFAS